MKIRIFLLLLFAIPSMLFSASVSGEELSKLANKGFKVKHFFFYSEDIGKAFLLVKKSDGGNSLYYFRQDGAWEPVSNAPVFRGMPLAKSQFDNMNFSSDTNTITFGEFTGDKDAKAYDPLAKTYTTVEMKTTKGDITLQLYNDVAPKAVENFIFLSENNHYNGLIFHRVIKGFMVQGGDPNGDGTGSMSKWGEGFDDEVSDDATFDKPYVLAMANSGPNTNGSQFFITFAQANWLNNKHTIFGKVIKGFDIVDSMEKVEVNDKDKPLKDIKIISMEVMK